MVCTRYMETMTNTICHYFIEVLERNSTRHDVLTRKLVIFINAITTILMVEFIDKEHERMQRGIKGLISTFVPIIHQPSELLLRHQAMKNI